MSSNPSLFAKKQVSGPRCKSLIGSLTVLIYTLLTYINAFNTALIEVMVGYPAATTHARKKLNALGSFVSHQKL